MTTPHELVTEIVRVCDERGLTMNYVSLFRLPDGSAWTAKVHVDDKPAAFCCTFPAAVEKTFERHHWWDHQHSDAITFICHPE